MSTNFCGNMRPIIWQNEQTPMRQHGIVIAFSTQLSLNHGRKVCGALISQCIKAAEIVAYEDLGPEAIRKLTVEDFPSVVVNDCKGGDLYADGRKQYEQTG